MAVAVVLILAAGVLLASRDGDDPGMPGMDMGSQPLERRGDAVSPPLTRGDGIRVADGADEQSEVWGR